MALAVGLALCGFAVPDPSGHAFRGTLAGAAFPFAIGVAYLINLATLPATGRAVLFVFRPELVIGSFYAALAIVLVAAWMPAERAARLKLVSALQYE